MINYKHLAEEEREILFYYINQWYKQKDIADILKRNPWTISRELKRNKTSIHPKHQEKIYLPNKANVKYIERRQRSYYTRKILNWINVIHIITFIQLWRSPKIISGYLKLMNIGYISHEAIYQFIYSKEYKYLKLWKYLPQKRKKRKKKLWRKVKREMIPNKIPISKRPEIINNRTEFGHWESDSIEWIKWRSWLHVSIERKTRFTKIRKITWKSTDITVSAMIDIFWAFIDWAIRSTTPDNWIEFLHWEKVKKEVWIDFYFTDPYSSRQKWSVERINWFIRRFFPKKTDFDTIGNKEIQYVESWINNRPMICLWYKTPKQMFDIEYSNLEHLTS